MEAKDQSATAIKAPAPAQVKLFQHKHARKLDIAAETAPIFHLLLSGVYLGVARQHVWHRETTTDNISTAFLLASCHVRADSDQRKRTRVDADESVVSEASHR